MSAFGKIDRDNFKEFVKSTVLKNCNCEHSDFLAWNTIPREIVQEHYKKIGDLNDGRYPHYPYTEFTNREGEYWSEEAVIALHFYPYQECEIYQCKQCENLFLQYLEHAGHGPQMRFRIVRPDLINDEISCFEFTIKNSKLDEFIVALGLDVKSFEQFLEAKLDRSRVPTNTGKADILISEEKNPHDQPEDARKFFVATDKNKILELIAMFIKST